MRITLHLVAKDNVFNTVKVILIGSRKFVEEWKTKLLKHWDER